MIQFKKWAGRSAVHLGFLAGVCLSFSLTALPTPAGLLQQKGYTYREGFALEKEMDPN